jgi:hypothetical protein
MKQFISSEEFIWAMFTTIVATTFLYAGIINHVKTPWVVVNYLLSAVFYCCAFLIIKEYNNNLKTK